jgi:hypothetical protein
MSKCNRCNSEGAYVSGFTVECINGDCEKYSLKWDLESSEDDGDPHVSIQELYEEAARLHPNSRRKTTKEIKARWTEEDKKDVEALHGKVQIINKVSAALRDWNFSYYITSPSIPVEFVYMEFETTTPKSQSDNSIELSDVSEWKNKGSDPDLDISESYQKVKEADRILSLKMSEEGYDDSPLELSPKPSNFKVRIF